MLVLVVSNFTNNSPHLTLTVTHCVTHSAVEGLVIDLHYLCLDVIWFKRLLWNLTIIIFWQIYCRLSMTIIVWNSLNWGFTLWWNTIPQNQTGKIKTEMYKIFGVCCENPLEQLQWRPLNLHYKYTVIFIQIRRLSKFPLQLIGSFADEPM